MCAIAGSVLLFVGTYLHPMEADPNEAIAAFAEYATAHLWVASHMTQLLGVALMVAALLFLSQQLESVSGTGWSRVAAGGAIASLAVAAALKAVDGIALKVMVDAWAAAPPAQKGGNVLWRFRRPPTGDRVGQHAESLIRPHDDRLRAGSAG
jgi:hypothetical protein